MKTRIANDAYYSPKKLISAWYREGGKYLFSGGDHILEPCCGVGTISDFLIDMHHDVTATDITMDTYGNYDATQRKYWEKISDGSPIDWTFTNPPFNQAVPIIEHALEFSRKGVIMILRASFGEPCKDRRHLLGVDLESVTTVNPRPRFREDTKGSDSATVAFFVWREGAVLRKPTLGYLTDWHKQN